RHIPGVQVDLKQNISLEGSQNILLFVNGKERNKSYISQMNPALIDRIEIMNTPPSNYDGNASGVINIVTKKESDTGISGHFFTEIPTSKSIVYSFPTYSIQYGLKKINLYTSYNGEINFENISETFSRQIRGTEQEFSFSSLEQVRQKNLSHKFHYGIDYYLTHRDIINYYGSVNPYSYEQDGTVIMDIKGDENRVWNAIRDETDKNLNIYNSLYYKHLFNEQGNEISLDISNSHLRASNSINYLNENNTGTATLLNTEKPEQGSTSIKIDYETPMGEKLLFKAGTKANIQSMRNETSTGFGYNEQVYAFYGMVHFKKTKYNLNLGLRAEYAETELKNDFNKTELYVLPYASFQYKLNAKQNLLFSYRRSVNRPSVFQLNPYLYIDNPFTVRKGNPLLEPGFRQHIYAEHSVRFGVNYTSYRLFYENEGNAINHLTFLKDNSVFVTQEHNLGNIHQYGLQFLGSLKLGLLTINPSIRLYNQSTSGNSLAKHYDITNRNNWVFDAGFSSVLSFKHDFTFSGTFQYSTVKYNIQDNTFSDPLYFLSLDKTIKNNLKIGIMTALPFTKTFVYQGKEIEAQNFSGSYHGNLKLPAFPLMFKVSYQFKRGKEKTMVDRDKEEVPMRPKSGF
ncbi:MAG: TonB-dependent receptor, partial [Bacteroidales bacterium]|nr:TonB-dependent receptor [Bacteroidales bacterium]